MEIYALEDDTHDPYEQFVTGVILNLGHPNIYIYPIFIIIQIRKI